MKIINKAARECQRQQRLWLMAWSCTNAGRSKHAWTCMEQMHSRRQLSVQKTLKATLGSNAKPTEMLTTAQHKATSEITGAEEQKSVQKWRVSTKYQISQTYPANFSSVQPQGRIQSRIPKLWPMNGLVGLRLRTGQRVKEYIHVSLDGRLMSLERKARQQANSRPTLRPGPRW